MYLYLYISFKSRTFWPYLYCSFWHRTSKRPRFRIPIPFVPTRPDIYPHNNYNFIFQNWLYINLW